MLKRRSSPSACTCSILISNTGINTSGAHFISHLAVGNVLYLSGTTPMKDGSRISRVSWGRISLSSKVMRLLGMLR